MKDPKEESLRICFFGHKVGTADLFKLLGLLAFIGITAGIVIALWPSLSQIFEPNGDRVIESIQSQGAFGPYVLGIAILASGLAFIPER